MRAETSSLEMFEYDSYGNVIVVARTSDPETSHEAAAAFQADQSKAKRCITTVVKILQAEGDLTDFEIRDRWSDYWGSDKWSFTLPCKARHWARQAGMVKHAGFGIHQGRKVRKWGIGCDTDFELSNCKCPTCGKPWKKPITK